MYTGCVGVLAWPLPVGSETVTEPIYWTASIPFVTLPKIV